MISGHVSPGAPNEQGGILANWMPTQFGDVLILRTHVAFTIHAVGPVSHDGQQDCHAQTNVKFEIDRAVAGAEAKALVRPGQRILFRNMDTCDWSEISHRETTRQVVATLKSTRRGRSVGGVGWLRIYSGFQR